MIVSQDTHLFVTALEVFLEAVKQQPLNREEQKLVLDNLAELHKHLKMEDDDRLKTAA